MMTILVYAICFAVCVLMAVVMVAVLSAICGIGLGAGVGFVAGSQFGADFWQKAWASYGDQVVYSPNGECNCDICKADRESQQADDEFDPDRWKRNR
jgi:hypothetical protein